MAANTPPAGGAAAPSPTLPATLAAAAASAAAALARDPTIPPEEHEARLHQHLLEQLGHMHRHAVGQMVMEQQAGGQMPPPPAWHMGPGSSHGGSPCNSLPHSPRMPPPAHRGLHPLSGAQYAPSPPPPAPLSVDGDLASPGRASGRPMSPMHVNGRSAPRPISARHSRSPLAGGGPHSTASSHPVRLHHPSPLSHLSHATCRHAHAQSQAGACICIYAVYSSARLPYFVAYGWAQHQLRSCWLGCVLTVVDRACDAGVRSWQLQQRRRLHGA